MLIGLAAIWYLFGVIVIFNDWNTSGDDLAVNMVLIMLIGALLGPLLWIMLVLSKAQSSRILIRKRAFPTDINDRIFEHLMELFLDDQEKVHTWLTTPHPNLGHTPPIVLIEEGQALAVLNFIESSESPVGRQYNH